MARKIGYDLLPIRSPGGWRKDWIGHILDGVGLEGDIFIYRKQFFQSEIVLCRNRLIGQDFVSVGYKYEPLVIVED